MLFVDFRILSLIQTRASEFRGHRQAYTTSFRWLVWMWSSNPWKVVTGGKLQEDISTGNHIRWVLFLYLPANHRGELLLTKATKPKSFSNCFWWKEYSTLSNTNISTYSISGTFLNQSVYEEISACVFEFINSVLFFMCSVLVITSHSIPPGIFILQ